MNNRNPRLVWDHVLGLSDSLAALTQTRVLNSQELIQFLESVEEVARDFDDPVEHYPEYTLECLQGHWVDCEDDPMDCKYICDVLSAPYLVRTNTLPQCNY